MNSLRPIVGNFPAEHLSQAWIQMSVGKYEDWNHYSTKGMFSPFAWAPWRMRGTIEEGSKFRPGIRCASVSDAWKLYYGLTTIELSDVSGSKYGTPRWDASGATAVKATRRADPDLWLAWNHVDVDDGAGGTYQEFSRPPEVLMTIRDAKKWDDLPPAGKEIHFMEDLHDGDGVYSNSRSRVRMWPWWYAETSGGELTGAVFLQVAHGFSGRYYLYASSYYHIQCYLGCQPYYFAYETQPKTFTISKQACGVNFELYGCYFATKGGNLGLKTPDIQAPKGRFEGAWF